MRLIALTFLLICATFVGNAQTKPAGKANIYDASTIPAALMTQQANAVLRELYEFTDLSNPTKNVSTFRRVVTVLREDGRRWARCQVHYRDKTSKVTNFSGSLYDANGALVRKLKQSEIQDISDSDDIDDGRSKIAEMMYGYYPFTIEYTYEVEGKGTFPVEYWTAQPMSSVSVEKSSYRLRLPSAETPHFKTFNIEKGDPSVWAESAGKNYQWTVDNVAASSEADFIANKEITRPTVFATWNNFSYLGFMGASDSWASFGEFFNKLNKGRGELPEDFKNELRTLVKDCATPLSKVEKIYDYLQKNTRYVSIQFGIGGFQPFPASDVCAKKYGDCKGLSNFTKAMLQVVGVRSHYTLVSAGSDAAPLFPDLVGNYFNHAFLCVPLERDTVWLECTSQNNPAGYCGSFTGNRDVLILTEKGGEVVHTPRYSEKDNREMRLATIKMDADGNATTDVRTLYSGLSQDLPRELATHGNEKDVRDFLIRNLHISSLELKDFKYAADRQRIPTVEEKLSLDLPHYGVKSGRRLFIQPNIFNKFNFETPDTTSKKPRKLGVVATEQGISESDSLSFELPEGYTIEHTPEPTTLKSLFGNYSATFKMDGKRLVYTRKLMLNNDEQPKESLGILLDFLREIEKADKMKVVLVAIK
jgi:transglutaminase-like putative cysteine protease